MNNLLKYPVVCGSFSTLPTPPPQFTVKSFIISLLLKSLRYALPHYFPSQSHCSLTVCSAAIPVTSVTSPQNMTVELIWVQISINDHDIVECHSCLFAYLVNSFNLVLHSFPAGEKCCQEKMVVEEKLPLILSYSLEQYSLPSERINIISVCLPSYKRAYKAVQLENRGKK